MTFRTIVILGFCALAGAEEDGLHRYLKGRWVYERNCAVCHGVRGKGDGEWAEGVDDRPRNFRSGVFKFRTTPVGKLPTDADLERTIREGVSGTMMPAFTKLSEADVDSVIHYIQILSRKWDDPERVGEPVELPAQPDWLRSRKEVDRRIAAGAKLFATHCAACHGAEGGGDGPAADGLIDFWGDPIRPADLTDPHHKSGPGPEDLLRTIACGLDGTPMAGFREAFDDEQLWSLVAYILSIEKTEGETP